MATHSSVLAWRIPWTEEPGGLWSIGSQRDTTEVTQHACITNKIIKKICGEKDNKRKDGKGLQNQTSPHST